MTPTSLKDRVRAHMDSHESGTPASRPYEDNYFHDYFRKLPFRTARRLLESAGVELNGKSVHVAGCGLGTDLYHLRQMYPTAHFHATDISAGAIRYVLQKFPDVSGQAEDMEKLSFADDTFDWSFAAACIHHLPRPVMGVYELLRVSRRGVIFIEPHDSWLVRRFTALHLAQEYEAVGNFVFRWSRDDVRKLCRSMYYDFDCATLFAIHRVAGSRMEFEALRALNFLANKLAAGAGNYIVACIRKPQH